MSVHILHLSDIHLLALGDDNPRDLNRQVREELEDDVRRLVAQLDGRMHAVVVGGDIAYSGDAEEFLDATKWIEVICEIAGCTHNDVFCVPGNHDVTRSIADANGLVRVVETVLRTCPPDRIDDCLDTVLRAPEGGDTFLGRLDAYHKFALQYDCGVEPEQHRWKTEMQFKLDGRTVFFVGLNSALISSSRDGRRHDCPDNQKLMLGTGQAYLHRRDGSIVVAICHHPPRWLRDEALVATYLGRAQIQLYGHEHTPGLEDRGSTLVVHAGAVQPARSERTATPAYNVLTLDTDGDVLCVDVRARQWNGSQFGPDPKSDEIVTHEVMLEPKGTVERDEETRPADSDRRDLMWQLMQIGPDARRKVLAKIGVVAPDKLLSATDLQHAVIRIADENLWERLREELKT
jgi:predicted phosphodiesterase